MRIKICGITIPAQGLEIARMGATDLGFICVASSPRYVLPGRLAELIAVLPKELVKVGVFADASVTEIVEIVSRTGLNALQLHGSESIEFCQQLRQELPEVNLIKAWRVKETADLDRVVAYSDSVDTLLLDAYHPHILGGTGHTLDWQTIASFQPPIPWLLAGGLNPDNICTALSQLHPDGIDLSSGVEISPGNKDLSLVERLFSNLSSC
jgi:phosphoribosylanthranilate isomerase